MQKWDEFRVRRDKAIRRYYLLRKNIMAANKIYQLFQIRSTYKSQFAVFKIHVEDKLEGFRTVASHGMLFLWFKRMILRRYPQHWNLENRNQHNIRWLTTFNHQSLSMKSENDAKWIVNEVIHTYYGKMKLAHTIVEESERTVNI